jgi:hypothetical protein
MLASAAKARDPWKAFLNRWYREAIPRAERLYAVYLGEREREAADGRR